MTQAHPTACILCECNCGLEVELGGPQGRSLVRARGDKRHPASRGYACEKAHTLDSYQNAKDRIMLPLRKRADGSFETIDWDTAIREVADRLREVRDTFGGDSIFYYGGGGQGNHLPGAYATATRRILGSRYRSSALAQEKTGEFWISDRMMGSATRADFEHCDVALFLGKNPWHSHSIPRARVTLKEIAKDPARTLIVVDPRRSETADLADIHLAVRPGTDAWLLAGILHVLVQEQLFAASFVRDHTVGFDPIATHLSRVSLESCAAACGIPAARIREVAGILGRARALATFEDLGVQMNRHSTLVSYLHRVLIALTGSMGRPGTHYIPTTLISMTGGDSGRKSPVVGAPIIAGLVPCNVIADEILTDHPKRYRAMIVEAANPAHSLADSKRMREALASLHTVVVIDVAMSETARMADYVLPACTQFEKAEATFFNFEFPENYFHLRPRLLPPPEGPLPEAEIHARLVEALGALTETDYAPLREAAREGRSAYVQEFMSRVVSDARLSGLAPVILYRTLDLPVELREGAVMLGLFLRATMERGESLGRAGFTGSPLDVAVGLFEKLLASPSGMTFAVDRWSDVLGRIATVDKKIHLELPDMLEAFERMLAEGGHDTLSADFPFVLSAGERRAYTANTIMRDPAWRKKDASGSLRMSPEDARALGVTTGDWVELVTQQGRGRVNVEVSDRMGQGHVSLPNGLGLGYPASDGPGIVGLAPNELTASQARDPFVGTPHHKYVPVRIERVDMAGQD